MNSPNSAAFILGGGPSLENDWPIIKDKVSPEHIYCVNNSYKLSPNSNSMLFGDFCWFEWNHVDLMETYHGKIYSTAPKFNSRYGNSIEFITIDDKNGGLWTKNKTRVNGNNSGHHMINLVYHLGYKNVVLIGFDMNRELEKTHWHNDHKRATNKKLYTETMIPGMERISEQIRLESIDFTVYNANYNSAIRCFEFCNVRKFLV